jgi:Protein of unknown function (DUF3768)
VPSRHSIVHGELQAQRALKDAREIGQAVTLMFALLFALQTEARCWKSAASHEEHDFGVFEVDGNTIFFKIDYFDKSRCYHSPDPSDPSVTERVITIMLAEEY